MKIIVCVDNENGLSFNGRRQSRDPEVYARIGSHVGTNKLWVSPSAAGLFSGIHDTIVDADYLTKAGDNDYCFVEFDSLLDIEDQISEVVVFHWNRHYPADRFLDIEVDCLPWTNAMTETFQGQAHDELTMEVFVR